jgi:hypothetical protein
MEVDKKKLNAKTHHKINLCDSSRTKRDHQPEPHSGSNKINLAFARVLPTFKKGQNSTSTIPLNL